MKLFLHIGTEKTGTTTIQDFLVENEAGLRSAGIGILKSVGLGNNRDLAICAMDYSRNDGLTKSRNLIDKKAREVFNREVEKKLRHEISSLPSHIHSVVISSEHFHSRLVLDTEVSRLKKVLEPYFESLKVICYFRPQVDLAASLYSTALRVGFKQQPEQFMRSELRSQKYYYNYFEIYKNWAASFGSENVLACLYDRSLFVEGCLIQDFTSCLGVDLNALKLSTPKSANNSISSLGQHILRFANENYLISVEGKRDFLFWLETNFSGPGDKLSYAEAVDLQSHYSQINQQFFEEAGISHYQFKVTDRIETVKESVSDATVEAIIALYLQKGALSKHDVDVIRDSAISLEKTNFSLSLDLMKIALRFRPHGNFMLEKLSQYNRKLKSLVSNES